MRGIGMLVLAIGLVGLLRGQAIDTVLFRERSRKNGGSLLKNL